MFNINLNETSSEVKTNWISFEKEPTYFLRSFGERNSDKTFYIIWSHKAGRGFFSIFSQVLSHLQIADELDMIPIIDMLNFKTHYNEDSSINEVNNSWEYYFKPVSNFSLEEVYLSKNVVFCNGNYPPNKTMSITKNTHLYDIFDKYVEINDCILKTVTEYLEEEFFGSKVLGVHFRGQEFRTAPGHWFPPTQSQIINKAKTLIKLHDFNKIFLVTEEQSYLDIFKQHFGEMVICTNSFRTYNKNSYYMYPRINHKYLLGLEILKDTLLLFLSKCDGLLCSDSNVSETAKFFNREQYEIIYKIDNGANSNNPILARYLWFIKKYTPEILGGFSGN